MKLASESVVISASKETIEYLLCGYTLQVVGSVFTEDGIEVIVEGEQPEVDSFVAEIQELRLYV